MMHIQSVTVNPHIMISFESSEFDIFASKPLQEFLLETTKVVHKPITCFNQSDLEFLIPADTGTYIDLDINLYIRGKLTSSDGTPLDNKD
jgi:hypothetical protein